MLLPDGTPATPQGPFQAFGSVHRALGEVDDHLTTMQNELASIVATTEVKLKQLKHKTQQHDHSQREEMLALVADVEALIVQMRSEHQPVISEHRRSICELQARRATEAAADRTTLMSHQHQIDALVAEVHRQQDIIIRLPGESLTKSAVFQASTGDAEQSSSVQGKALAACKAETDSKVCALPNRETHTPHIRAGVCIASDLIGVCITRCETHTPHIRAGVRIAGCSYCL